jgi:hypothetical protein
MTLYYYVEHVVIKSLKVEISMTLYSQKHPRECTHKSPSFWSSPFFPRI